MPESLQSKYSKQLPLLNCDFHKITVFSFFYQVIDIYFYSVKSKSGVLF